MKDITSWNIICSNNVYRAPELICYFVAGKCEDKSIRTSSIVSVDGNVVKTHSGSLYRLIGEPVDMSISDNACFASLEEVVYSIKTFRS